MNQEILFTISKYLNRQNINLIYKKMQYSPQYKKHIFVIKKECLNTLPLVDTLRALEELGSFRDKKLIYQVCYDIAPLRLNEIIYHHLNWSSIAYKTNVNLLYTFNVILLIESEKLEDEQEYELIKNF